MRLGRQGSRRLTPPFTIRNGNILLPSVLFRASMPGAADSLIPPRRLRLSAPCGGNVHRAGAPIGAPANARKSSGLVHLPARSPRLRRCLSRRHNRSLPWPALSHRPRPRGTSCRPDGHHSLFGDSALFGSSLRPLPFELLRVGPFPWPSVRCHPGTPRIMRGAVHGRRGCSFYTAAFDDTQAVAVFHASALLRSHPRDSAATVELARYTTPSVAAGSYAAEARAFHVPSVNPSSVKS